MLPRQLGGHDKRSENCFISLSSPTMFSRLSNRVLTLLNSSSASNATGSIVKAGPKNFHEMVSRWVEGIIWNQLLKFPKISGAQITILYPWKIYSRIAELPMADEAWRCVSCIHFCETTSRWKWVWVKPLVKIPWWKRVKSKKVDKWMFILQTMVLWCFDSSPTFIGRSISIAHV